jgi:hypothetical protein
VLSGGGILRRSISLITLVDLVLLSAYILVNFVELSGISGTAYTFVRQVNWSLISIVVFWDHTPSSGVLGGGFYSLFNWSFLVLLGGIVLNLGALLWAHVSRVAAMKELQAN